MRVAILLAAASLIPLPAFAQGHESFVQGFGGLSLAVAPTISPTVGATVGVGLTPHFQVIGEVGRIGSARTDAITNLALRFVNTTDRVGAFGSGVILQGGPIVATIGYRFTRFFSNDLVDTLVMAGHPDVHEARVSFGVRF
jgi:hypothetical protein